MLSRISTVLAMMALGVVVPPASAQEAVDIVPRLRAGDAFRIVVVRTREDSEQPQRNQKITTPIDVRVLSASDAGAVLEWEPGEAEIEQGAPDLSTLAAAGALEDLKLRLALNGRGEITGLVNEDEVRRQVEGVADAVMKEAASSFSGADRKAFESFLATILSPANLIGMATRDAQTYFALNGLVLEPGSDLTADLDRPNPLGDGTLPATLRIALKAASPAMATVTTSLTYQPAALLAMTQRLLERTGKPVSPEELSKLPPMRLSDEGSYELDRATGLMRAVIVDRVVSVESMKRRDRWEIRLVNPPQR